MDSTDNDMTADWENGVFCDNFRGVWGAIDGSYSMVIEMRDAAGSYAYSDAVTFDCAGGEIWTAVYGDRPQRGIAGCLNVCVYFAPASDSCLEPGTFFPRVRSASGR